MDALYGKTKGTASQSYRTVQGDSKHKIEGIDQKHYDLSQSYRTDHGNSDPLQLIRGRTLPLRGRNPTALIRTIPRSSSLLAPHMVVQTVASQSHRTDHGNSKGIICQQWGSACYE